MSKRQIVAILAIGVMLTLAGCAGINQDTSPNEQTEELSDATGVESDAESVGESYWYEIGVTEANQQNLVRTNPPFQMDNSLERQNLIRRYQYLNDRNNVHHVYLLSRDGKVIDYSMAQGKVSSVNSKLTNDKQIVEIPQARFEHGVDAGAEGPNFKVVESPQMDGSYGSNGNAIFWFTPSGHYMEWNGLYLVSEEPKGITTEVTLTEDVGDDSIVEDNSENSSD